MFALRRKSKKWFVFSYVICVREGHVRAKVLIDAIVEDCFGE